MSRYPDSLHTDLAGDETSLRPVQVARYLGLHANTVKRIPFALLPFSRVTTRGDRRYRESDVMAYVAYCSGAGSVQATVHEPAATQDGSRGDVEDEARTAVTPIPSRTHARTSRSMAVLLATYSRGGTPG